MNSVSLDIANLLANDGEGVAGGSTESAWGIFRNDEPPSPDNTVTVYDTPGRVSKAYNVDNHGYFSAFLIRVRAKRQSVAEEKAKAIIAKLDRRGQFNVGDVWYNNITIDDEPLFLKKDDNQRYIFTFNGIGARQNAS